MRTLCCSRWRCSREWPSSFRSVGCALTPCVCARRIIGVQSFSGSFRRSCYLLPTLGQDEIQLDQQCGGYVDSGTLVPTGYVALDGTPQKAKGYICPLGQVCKVRERRKYRGVSGFVWGRDADGVCRRSRIRTRTSRASIRSISRRCRSSSWRLPTGSVPSTPLTCASRVDMCGVAHSGRR